MASILEWTRHPDFPDAKEPKRAHATDAGLDFFAAEDTFIRVGEIKRVRTGICVHPTVMPIGQFRKYGQHENANYASNYNNPGGWTFASLVWDKSGVAGKGITCLGGVIDDLYTGEILAVVVNLNLDFAITNLTRLVHSLVNGGQPDPISFVSEITGKPFKFEKGAKVAQLIVQRIELPVLKYRDSLDTTARGSGGFGSTGE